MNVNDSDKIAAMLAVDGYQQAMTLQDADLIILNTCSVRAKAEEKVYSHLATYKGLKRRKPTLLMGVGGCVAQQEGEKLLEKVPHLDFVFGTHTLHLLPEIVAAAERGVRQSVAEFLDPEQRRELLSPGPLSGGITRFVTVMQGCDNFCSYCIVPHVRGREVSRRSVDICTEVAALAENGVREITLLGQNVNSYGLKESDEPDFAGLLHMVAETPGIERIRFTTSHPKDMAPCLIDCFATLPRLCSHLHLPLQAGSDRILTMMNRGYTLAQYMSLVTALRRVRPDISLSADIIVGFPGETEEEFQETLTALREIRFTDLFSFIYSARPGTAAADLPETISRQEKQNRLVRLQELQMAITLEHNRALEGTVQTVLVEGISRRGDQLYGRTDGNRIVNFPGSPDLVGSIVPVTIVSARQTSVVGELTPDEPERSKRNA